MIVSVVISTVSSRVSASSHRDSEHFQERSNSSTFGGLHVAGSQRRQGNFRDLSSRFPNGLTPPVSAKGTTEFQGDPAAGPSLLPLNFLIALRDSPAGVASTSWSSPWSTTLEILNFLFCPGFSSAAAAGTPACQCKGKPPARLPVSASSFGLNFLVCVGSAGTSPLAASASSVIMYASDTAALQSSWSMKTISRTLSMPPNANPQCGLNLRIHGNEVQELQQWPW